MISAIIPWKTGCSYREHSLEIVVDRLTPVVDEVVIGEIAGEWCKAEAVADGVNRASGDVLVVHDADVFIDGPWVNDCLGALFTFGWATPHRWVNRLETNDLHGNLWALPRKRHEAFLGGGIVVLPRETYLDCPLDPRFKGWGQEDECWALALTALRGAPWRGDHSLWHLWHPPQKRINRRWGSPESRRLHAEYESDPIGSAGRARDANKFFATHS